MLVFDHFLTDVQQLLSRKICCNLYLFSLVRPHALLQSHIHLCFFDSLRLSLLFHSFFIFFCEVFSLNHFGLFLDHVGYIRGVFLQKGFFQQYRFVTEYQSNCSFLSCFEGWILNNNRISFLNFSSEKSLISMNGPAAGSDTSNTKFRLIIYNLILNDDIILRFLILIFILSGLFRNVSWFADSFFKFKLSELHIMREFYKGK